MTHGNFFAGLALLLYTSLFPACRKPTTLPAPAARATDGAGQRYWLSNTSLSRPGKGGPIEVREPTLVELLDGNRVRSVPGATRAFEGALPSDILREPQLGRGLMLYAQRTADLRLRRPDGPVVGRLHRGAFVSVVPGTEPAVRISSLPFERESERIVSYVERSALTSEAHQPAAFRPPAGWRAKLLPSVTGWVDDPQSPAGTSRAAWQTLDCKSLWVSARDSRVTQVIAGVELSGRDDDQVFQLPSVIYETLRCPANPGAEPLGISPSEPLSERIARGGSVHWLIENEAELVCDAWQFRSEGASKGRLVRRRRHQGQVASFPFSFQPANATTHAALSLATLELDGRAALRCPCPIDYQLLGVAPDHLLLMAHPLPPGASSFDPGEAERWFLSAERCEAARKEATERLERDGSTATRLGLHAVFSALGI